jgi:hypothetical protein
MKTNHELKMISKQITHVAIAAGVAEIRGKTELAKQLQEFMEEIALEINE